jgi:hypothetical protein
MAYSAWGYSTPAMRRGHSTTATMFQLCSLLEPRVPRQWSGIGTVAGRRKLAHLTLRPVIGRWTTMATKVTGRVASSTSIPQMFPLWAKWNGGTVTGVGIFNSGCFSLDMNSNLTWDSGTDKSGCFGQSGDTPLVGEWEGGGITRVGIYRPSNTEFALDWNQNLTWDAGTDQWCTFGIAGDLPVVGDWTGTGVTRIGIFRPSSGLWAQDTNGNRTWDAGTDLWGVFGTSIDTPIVGRLPGTAQVSTVSDLQNCIGTFGTTVINSGLPNSVYNVCQLTQNRSPVSTTLNIGRSSITIMGGSLLPADTTLYRGANIANMIIAGQSATKVAIADFTIDGNRYGFPSGLLSCLPGNAGYQDIELNVGAPVAGKFTLEWLDFINAPGTALQLNGSGSSVILSNFGQGGYAVGPAGTLGYHLPPEFLDSSWSATRSTAVWLSGSGDGAWYNMISYAGTAAITFDGSSQFAYGNSLFQNRYEISDVETDESQCQKFGLHEPCLNQGGQLALNPGSSYASVAGNVINGNNYAGIHYPYPTPTTGCPLGNGHAYNAGIEGLGIEIGRASCRERV